jgi:16S rRNA processing protein RimM
VLRHFSTAAIMQSSSILCCSNPISQSFSLAIPQLSTFPCRNQTSTSNFASISTAQLTHNCSLIHRRDPISSNCTATQEIVETGFDELELVEVGYICAVHGIRGEVRIKPNTGFPELRFSKPGKRWLRQQVSGREKIQEVELLEGRDAQKGWIVRFGDISSPEQAEQLVGSTVLVSDDNRPDLDEGEFYSRDLVGMTVILKESGEPVGTVVNVYNSGASDLLHVMLNSKKDEDFPDPLVWVPFVEEIVPIVDMSKREMQITPPEGLLELNLPTHKKSKKERRVTDWYERKKYQRRLISAKKKLCEMEQQHIFHGFKSGDKTQTKYLSDQILGVNSHLFRIALENIQVPSTRWNLPEYMAKNLTDQVSTMKLPKESQNGAIANSSSKLQDNGTILVSKGKVAIVAVVSQCAVLETLLSHNHNHRLVKMEDRGSVPLVLVCPAHEISLVESMFSDNEHFGFDSEKVWFLEEEKLPVINNSVEEEKKHKILMKSQWEILQAPVGSGSIISLISSNNIVDILSEVGIEYIEVCSVNERFYSGESLLGLVYSRKSDLGIQTLKDSEYIEEDFHMIFSMKFMQHLIKQVGKLHFHPVEKENSHVEKVDKDWVNITPSSPNSYELHSSIYSSFSACRPGKVCVVEIV